MRERIGLTGNDTSCYYPGVGWLHTLFGQWRREAGGQPALRPPSLLVCYGCRGDRIVMVLPASPEALTYRCAACGRQWSMRALPRVQMD